MLADIATLFSSKYLKLLMTVCRYSDSVGVEHKNLSKITYRNHSWSLDVTAMHEKVFRITQHF